MPRSPWPIVLQVAPVLDVERLVEPVLMADLRDRLRRRALAEQRLRGRARQERGSSRRRGSRARAGSGRAGAAGGRRSEASSRPPAAPDVSYLRAESDGRERLERDRARHVALHVLLERERRLDCARTGSSAGTSSPGSIACWYSACRAWRGSSPQSAFCKQREQRRVVEPELRVCAPKWTFRKFAGSPKSPVQPSR